VTGEVIVAGGRVSINGHVTGHVRVAGGQVAVNGDVTKDVAVAGGQVTVAGKVGQDLIVGVGELTLTGTVAGSTAGSAGAYTKSGTVSGTDSITISRNEEPRAPVIASNPVVDAIRHFIAVLLIALLVMWLAPRLLPTAGARVEAEPLPSLAWGVLACIAYVVAVIVIAIAIILLAIGLGALGFGNLLGLDLFAGFVTIAALTLAFIVAVAFLADAVVGLAIGRVLAGQMGRRTAAPTADATDRWADLGWLAVGVAIVVIITSIPVIGGWLKLLVAFVGLGALWLARRTDWWRRTTVTDTTTAPPPPAVTA
jgi:hypothetical protein